MSKSESSTSDKHAGKTPRADALSKRMEGRALAECSVEFFSLACELELELRALAAEYADLKVYGRSAPSAASTSEPELVKMIREVEGLNTHDDVLRLSELIRERNAYKQAWEQWRSLQTGDATKLFDAAMKWKMHEQASASSAREREDYGDKLLDALASKEFEAFRSSEQPTSAAAGSTKAAKGDDSHREGLATESHATPLEPTADMLKAGARVRIDHLRSTPDSFECFVGTDNAAKIYRAMIAAAPASATRRSE